MCGVCECVCELVCVCVCGLKAEGLYKECLDLLRELKEKTDSNSNSKIDKRKGGRV